MGLILFILIVWLFFSQINLRGRVADLEERQKVNSEATKPLKLVTKRPADFLLTQRRVEPVFTEDYPSLNDITPALPASLLTMPDIQTVTIKSDEFFIETWFKEHTLLKVGGLIFFLGAVWLLSVAVSEGWLNEESRVLSGFIFAGTAFFIGWQRRNSNFSHYPIFTTLGMSIMTATIVAAYTLYNLISLPLALGLLLASFTYTALVSYCSKSTWLLLVVAAAGYLAPLLFVEQVNTAILVYVFVFSAALLVASVWLLHRGVSLAALVGSTLYISEASLGLETSIIWLTVCLLTPLTFFSYMLLLLRKDKVETRDVFFFLAVGLIYITQTLVLSPSPDVAVFAAALLVALTGYFLTRLHKSLTLVAICGSLSAIFVLLGCSLLLSGASLILTFSLLITGAFMVVTYLGLSERVLLATTAAYCLPTFYSWWSFAPQTSAWQTGVWHADALAILGVAASFLVSLLWLFHQRSIRIYPSSPIIAATFGVVGYFYFYVVVAQFIQTIFPSPEADVIQYVLWALQTLGVIFYLLRRQLPILVTEFVLFTYSLPLLLSLNSLASEFWQDGFQHVHGFGVLWVIVMLVLILLLLLQTFVLKRDRRYLRLLGLSLFILVLYVGLAISSIFSGVFDNVDLSLVATYMSYLLILYILTSIFAILRAPLLWIQWVLAGYLVPVTMALSSISLTGYSSGALVPEAVGIFTVIIALVMTAVSLKERLLNNEDEYQSLSHVIKILYAVAFIYAVILSWSLAHSYLEVKLAVSVILFIYTIIGLILYLRAPNLSWRYAGITLLILVVARLLLVDFSAMAIMGKALTFLGIGFLFIVAALLERPSRSQLPKNNLRPSSVKQEE